MPPPRQTGVRAAIRRYAARSSRELAEQPGCGAVARGERWYVRSRHFILEFDSCYNERTKQPMTTFQKVFAGVGVVLVLLVAGVAMFGDSLDEPSTSGGSVTESRPGSVAVYADIETETDCTSLQRRSTGT